MWSILEDALQRALRGSPPRNKSLSLNHADLHAEKIYREPLLDPEVAASLLLPIPESLDRNIQHWAELFAQNSDLLRILDVKKPNSTPSSSRQSESLRFRSIKDVLDHYVCELEIPESLNSLINNLDEDAAIEFPADLAKQYYHRMISPLLDASAVAPDIPESRIRGGGGIDPDVHTMAIVCSPGWHWCGVSNDIFDSLVLCVEDSCQRIFSLNSDCVNRNKIKLAISLRAIVSMSYVDQSRLERGARSVLMEKTLDLMFSLARRAKELPIRQRTARNILYNELKKAIQFIPLNKTIKNFVYDISKVMER